MTGFGRKKPVRTVLEKRKSTRSSGTASATVLTTVASASATVVDLSTGGAGLTSPNSPQKGRDVQLQIGEHILFGDVAWKNDEAFGLRFDEALDKHALEVIGGVLKDVGAESIIGPNSTPSDS